MSGAVLNLMGASGGGGASSTTITVAAQYIEAYNTGASATATYRLNLNGSVYQKLNAGAYTLVPDGAAWCIPASQAANYECYATLSSGSGVTGSAFNTWLPLTATQEWTVNRATIGVNDATINVGIRRVGDTTIVANDIYLYAERY